jgi:hypothetical protein
MRVTPRYIVPTVLLGIVAIALFTFLGGTVVRLLWNWLLPPLFGFKMITFWQAIGILALSRILFGGFHGGGGRWRQNRTPEEREQARARFRERIRKHFGFQEPAAPPPAQSTEIS